MNATLLLGLTLQAAAVAVVLMTLRRRWLASAGGLFVAVAFLYHGLSEIVQRAFPGHNDYRMLVGLASVDLWTVLAGAAMLCFAAAYCLTFLGLGPRRRRVARLPLVSGVPGWGVLLILSVVSRLVMLSGQDLGYWVNNIAAYFSGLMLVLGCAGLVLRKGPAYVLPAALGSSLFLALGGSRGEVVLYVVLLLGVLKRLDMPLRFSRLVAVGAVVAVLVILISAARVASGRLDQQAENTAPALADRFQWLASGSQVAGAGEQQLTALAEDFSYRFDGNAFPALVLEDLQARQTTPGLTSFWRNFVLQIPSVLMPGKLDQDPRMLFEEDYSITFFRLPEGIDYLPMTLGILFTYYGGPGLLLFALLLGAMYGLVDHVAMQPRSLVALLTGISFSWAALRMEQGVMVYFGTIRTLLMYLVAIGPVALLWWMTRAVVRTLRFELKMSTR